MEFELEEKKQLSAYRKIRYYLLVENIFIVLAFLLFAVSAYHFVAFGIQSLIPYIYAIAGIGFFVVGIVIAIKMTKAFNRDDIPVYSNIMASNDVDPEIGLLYYDGFTKVALEQVSVALTPVYLASFQIEGVEHLRHFVGYQKAADTMAEVGEVFKHFQKKMGERYVSVGCKSGHEILLTMHECEPKDIQNYLTDLCNQVNEIMLRLATTENFTVFCGYSCYPTQSNSFEETLKNTGHAVYEAVMFRKSEPHMFSPDSFKRQEKEYVKDNKIRKLLDSNELHYNFQPIVSAKTGKIFAYEALMRTHKEMGLSPTDVLELAERQDRLYEVEHYTFYNVIKIMNEHAESFEKRKLFINSIPTAIIKEDEFSELLFKYGQVMKSLVIEITENGMQSEESCAQVHRYMEKAGCELALDDYGTGYSNATTLINNSPHYLKVDHSLVMGIDTDSRKQHLVSNIVSFGNSHNMKILAEGVETPEELQMVIQLGCHLIQGFYTARPNAEIVDHISETIEDEIVAINLKLAKLAVENRVYETENYDNISLVNLGLDFYTQILIKHETTRIVGDKDREVNISIKVPDNLETVLAIRDINMRGRDMPAIELGENSKLILCIEGENTLSYEGIRVPKSSKLIVQGSGNLKIRVDHNNGVGIGCDLENVPYGNMLFEQEGTIRVETNGDMAIGIGGLLADENSKIKCRSGNVEIIANGSKSIGIGSVQGLTKITMDKVTLTISSAGAESIGIGSFRGDIDFKSVADIEMEVSGSYSAAIGSPNDVGGKIALNGGFTKCNVHCMEGIGIGSYNGTIDVNIFGDEVFLYMEGSEVGGVGNFRGSGNTIIRSGVVKITAIGANPISLGSLKGRLEISGGNIVADLANSPDPVNQFDMPVFEKIVETKNMYCKKIETDLGSYQYMASPTELFDNIHVYLPEVYTEKDLQL